MADPNPRGAATPLLYLDVDDEITSAAARIRSADAEHVAVVLPYGSRLATSRINFRLLAREAAERGKKIEIVSADSSARALAGAAGLTVHPSVAAFESHRSGMAANGAGVDGATAAAAGVGVGEARGHGTQAVGDDPTVETAIGPGTIAPPGAAAVPVGGLSTDDAATRVLPAPRRRGERVPVVGPPRPPMRTGLAVGLGLALIVLVAAGGLLALELLPTATIVLAPRSAPVGPISLNVEARLDAPVADPVALVIPAHRVVLDLEAAQTVVPTGVKVTETKATGNVTFSSFDTGSSNRIDAGAVVRTESGIAYRTLADVMLPAARIQFPFTVVPSTSTVGIEAVEPGPEGNVGNNSITVVPEDENRRLLQVTNEEATAGGSRVETSEVSQADVDAATVALLAELGADLDRQLAARVGVPADVTIFEQTEDTGEPRYSPDPTTLVGSPTEVELRATAEGSVLGVDTTPIGEIAETRLGGRVPDGWGLAPGSASFELGTPSVFGDVVSYPVTMAATQVRAVDPAALLEQIRGLLVGDARAVLDDYGDVEIAVWPDWVTEIPGNVERITLTLAEPRPAPSPTP